MNFWQRLRRYALAVLAVLALVAVIGALSSPGSPPHRSIGGTTGL